MLLGNTPPLWLFYDGPGADDAPSQFRGRIGLALCLAWTVSGSRLLALRLEAVSRLASSGLAVFNEYANPPDLAAIDGMG
jgi:hypothetical protein